jgi:hypothetical protein
LSKLECGNASFQRISADPSIVCTRIVRMDRHEAIGLDAVEIVDIFEHQQALEPAQIRQDALDRDAIAGPRNDIFRGRAPFRAAQQPCRIDEFVCPPSAPMEHFGVIA